MQNISGHQHINTLRPRQNGRHFPDDIFRCIFNENVRISINISLKFVPKGPITILQHWFRQWLGVGQATSHYRNQVWLVNWGIYASLGLNELIQLQPMDIQSLKRKSMYYSRVYSKQLKEIFSKRLTCPSWGQRQGMGVFLSCGLNVRSAAVVLCLI